MILYETKFLTLKAAKRDGKPDWVYVVRPNAKDVAVILPILRQENKEDEIIFLLTKRPPIEYENVAEYCIELPAGLVGDENPDETSIDAIQKELLEEIGHASFDIKINLTKVSSSAGLTSEVATIATAIITDPKIVKPPVDDGGIIIDRIYVKKSQIKNFITEMSRKGYSISSYALSALYFL